MDGGRRFSRSLKEQLHTLFSPVFPHPAEAYGSAVSFGASYQARAEYPESAESGVYAGEVHHGGRGLFERLAALVARPGFGPLR